MGFQHKKSCLLVCCSSDGDSELVRAKWLSIIRHIANIHEGHGDLYPACHHEEINRQWLNPFTSAFSQPTDPILLNFPEVRYFLTAVVLNLFS